MPPTTPPRLREEIYRLAKQGVAQVEIAQQLTVSVKTIQRVLQRAGFSWRDIMQLTPEAVAKIRQLYEEKDQWGRRTYSHRQLGKLFGVSSTTISNVINRLEAYQGEGLSDLERPATEEEKAEIQASLDRLMKSISETDKPKKEFPV